MTRPIETLGTHVAFDSGDYPALLDKALAAHRTGTRCRRTCGGAAPTARWSASASACSWRRAGSVRSTGCDVTIDTSRRRRGRHRRGLGRAGRRDRDRADLRRRARRRLSAHSGRARPDRPDRLWHGRLRLARDRDDRRGDAACGAEGSRQGDRCRGRAAAGAAGIISISSMARWSAPAPALRSRSARSRAICSPASKSLGDARLGSRPRAGSTPTT